jgi:hypothetical protein
MSWGKYYIVSIAGDFLKLEGFGIYEFNHLRKINCACAQLTYKVAVPFRLKGEPWTSWSSPLLCNGMECACV